MKYLFLLFLISQSCFSNEIMDLLIKDFSIKEIKNSKSLCKLYQEYQNTDKKYEKIDCLRLDVSDSSKKVEDINQNITNTLNTIPNISNQIDAYILDIVLSTP
jgi:hypothetical protein